MAKLRYSVIPTVVAFAALFLVLPSTGASATVTILGEHGSWRYDPVEIRLEAGARVAFTNDSGTTHTADCVDCPWSTGDVQPGDTRFVTVAESGAYTFRCRYHPLEGRVLVGDVDAGPIAEETPDPPPVGG